MIRKNNFIFNKYIKKKLNTFNNISFFKKEVSIHLYNYKKKYLLSLNKLNVVFFLNKYFNYLEWLNKFKLFTLKDFLKNKKISFFINNKKYNLFKNIKLKPYYTGTYCYKKDKIKKRLISSYKYNSKLSYNNNEILSNISFWNLNIFESLNLKNNYNLDFNNYSYKKKMWLYRKLINKEDFLEKELKSYRHIKSILTTLKYKEDIYKLNFFIRKIRFNDACSYKYAFRHNRNFIYICKHNILYYNNFIYLIWKNFKKTIYLILFLSSKNNKKKFKILLLFLMYYFKFFENFFIFLKKKQFLSILKRETDSFYDTLLYYKKKFENSLSTFYKKNNESFLNKMLFFYYKANSKKNNISKLNLINYFLFHEKKYKFHLFKYYSNFYKKKNPFHIIKDNFDFMYLELLKRTDRTLYNYEKYWKKYSDYKFNFLYRHGSWWFQTTRLVNYFDSDEDLIFSTFFSLPLQKEELFYFKFIKNNNFNFLKKVKYYKYKNKYFINVIDHNYLYKYFNNYINKKNFNYFYINNNLDTYISFFNSYYKRHLINKFKFNNNNIYLNYDLNYNFVNLNFPYINKKILFKFKYLYNYSYDNQYEKVVQNYNFYSRKGYFITFNRYYRLENQFDVLDRFKEFNIRNVFKHIYLYIFFYFFKKRFYFHIFSNLFNIFFNIKKKRILIKKKLTLFLHNNIGIITFKNTLRNVFWTLRSSNGKQLFSISSGSVGIFGYKKSQYLTIKNASIAFFERITKILYKNNIRKLKLVVKGYYNNFNHIIDCFYHRLDKEDRILATLLSYVTFLKKYLLYIKKEIYKKKFLFSLDFNKYFNIINYGTHILNYLNHEERRTPYYLNNFQIIFIQLKNKKSFLK